MKKWTVQDRDGNTIYLTEERWQHILESRPDMEPYGEIMSDVKLHRSEVVAANGETIRLVYDEGGDMLDIFFGENEPANRR